MRFYYTGSKEFLGLQADPSKSLGGFVSSSLIPNSGLNNLFGEVSSSLIQKDDYFEVIGLVLKNETGGSINNISFYLDIPEESTSICKYEFNFVSIKTDTKGNLSVEKLINKNSLPYSGSFMAANGIENKINITNTIVNNSYIGIFIKREIDTDKAKSQFTDTAFEELYKAGGLKLPKMTKDETELKIDWEEVVVGP